MTLGEKLSLKGDIEQVFMDANLEYGLHDDEIRELASNILILLERKGLLDK